MSQLFNCIFFLLISILVSSSDSLGAIFCFLVCLLFCYFFFFFFTVTAAKLKKMFFFTIDLKYLLGFACRFLFFLTNGRQSFSAVQSHWSDVFG